ncbi:glycerol-3-phosphate dehydrogenase [NAD(P)+] [Desulfomarina profundi]|uniref:Glycerol-3-phosphate dehydrogenase [NAD(P)+] n=1 Tax=Desulfomarina profundi TaxID=2772557 RepID=A0A8D5FJE1_9BACT|nr:NAD(P)H-dependent glycerol-3-phosphate dehydrogenase [Desulfomarina profundi]BCL62727.1 glycerol-3-phosphate dehydrogenase [NAD(P)+] [Desulfomarina profundi]
MTENKTISVIGAGSWGTALALVLAENQNNVFLWGHNRRTVRKLQEERQNKKYLPGIQFPDNLKITGDLELCVGQSAIILMVVPSHGLRDVFNKLAAMLPDKAYIISAVKGIENSSLETMTMIMESVLQQRYPEKNCEIGVLSGPSFAKEVAQRVPTAVTLGFKNLATAKKLQKVFGNSFFRVYAGCDITGLEISASYKNIIAIAAGVCDGLGYGLNTRAALITRGLTEMTRLGTALGADISTFSGLSGLGDLLLTCTGNLSRNRTVGLKLGKGKQLEEIVNEMKMVAEGIKTTRSIFEIRKKYTVETPILDEVYKIIYQGKKCSLAVSDLLARELKVE